MKYGGRESVTGEERVVGPVVVMLMAFAVEYGMYLLRPSDGRRCFVRS